MNFENNKEKEIYDLFEILGEDKYLDRFIVDKIIFNVANIRNDLLEEIIKDIILKKNYNREKLYHIIDICIEVNMDLLDDNTLIFIVEKYKLDFDLVSILIEYTCLFKRHIFKRKIYDFLEYDYPESIKAQILSWIASLEGMEGLEDLALITCENKEFYDDYINFLKGKIKFKQGFSILQSMFYGDFENSGKGNNGGLAILLKNLGDEISKDHRVSYVFTITITKDLDKGFINYYGDKHIFIRLPIYLDRDKSDPFVKRELAIKRYIKNFLEKTEIHPNVFHIRYLDNASKAVASLSKELDKKLVLTLAPDPHRNMCDDKGMIKQFSLNELISNMNKIKIGDELICKSDAILGIGNEKVKKELEIYFPQFKEKHIKNKIEMIGEGIQTDILEEKINLNEFSRLNNICPNFFEKPIILNVGRLAIQKGQIQLLQAWHNSNFSKTHNLLIIGGDLEKPSQEEEKIIDFFKEYEKLNPRIKDVFFHKSAMANEKIRLLEKSIMENDFAYPHLYIYLQVLKKNLE